MKKLALLLLSIFCFSCDNEVVITSKDNTASTLTTDEYLETVAELYIYGYPMVLMDLTKQVSTNAVNPHPVRPRAPINQLAHFRTFPDHTLKTVVKPNLDTYYSIAWLDLSQGAQALHMPATDRYHLLPFYDMFSNVYASPGTRTVGTDEHDYYIVGPDWTGTCPEGYTLIQSPTNISWMLGRIQVNSKEDGDTIVKAIQDGMSLVPYKQLTNENYIEPSGQFSEDIAKIIPVKDIEKLDIEEYLNRLSQLLANNPPLAQDSLMVLKMQKIGFEPGNDFQLYTDDFMLSQKLNLLPGIIHDRLRAVIASPPAASLLNNWRVLTEEIGTYDTDYKKRAFIAMIALGANLPEDAVYPVSNIDINGDPLMGDKKYKIHMDEESLPSVEAFWSLTVYTVEDFLVENEHNRFSLSSRDSLIYNADGSLDLWIQHDQPSEAPFENWLPTPENDPFTLTMRLYWPSDRILKRQWSPPAIVPVSQ